MNKAVRYVATWGALFVVVGFFFPREPDIERYYGQTINGLGAIKYFLVFSFREFGSFASFISLFMAILVFLIFASAALYVSNVMYGTKIRRISRFLKYVPFSVFLFIIIIQVLGKLVLDQERDLSELKIGIYGTFIGSIAMLFPGRKN